MIEHGIYVQLYSPSTNRSIVVGPFADEQAAQEWIEHMHASPGPRAAHRARTVKPTDWQGTLMGQPEQGMP